MSPTLKRIDNTVYVLVAKPLSLAIYVAWLASQFVWKTSVSLAANLRRRLSAKTTSTH